MNIKVLDGLRGLAALYVMIGHARWLLWEGYSEGYLKHTLEYSWMDKMSMYFLSMFKFGHESVLLFFVLSGFVIHKGYVKKFLTDSLQSVNIGQFYIKRIRRIYPPFLFALCLTALLDFVGRDFGFSIYTGNTPNEGINITVGNQSLTLVTFIGNVFFLFKEYVPIFGTNGPTWSLKLEWWFYMIYPIFLLLSRKNIYYSTLLIVLLFSLVNYSYFWTETLSKAVFSSIISWWAGVLLAEVYSKRIGIGLLNFAVINILGFFLLPFLPIYSDLYDFRIALLLTALICCILYFQSKNISFKLIENFKFFGDFSYTLYIIHFPILVFISGIVLKLNQNQLPKHSFFVLLGIIVSLGVAYLTHFLVELPFMKPKTSKQ
ncbi:acyltransferase [Lacihabitans sp. CS3-21]|uniref:acyltransferase family protein n=1 Tax=Lacihabitans sp. CS3-21 TaxID=2487332 RepID=UPI0020CD2BDC|nr:acyltransferase [Lacihabitans sp. CS3-21]MCP9748268.1 acyltransferase [Lacihabitans sp. CS3-21]